jgi:cytochrome c2
MPYMSAKTGSAILLAVAVAIFAFGFTYNKIEDRDRLREHAAATVGGDPSRGEAMFIQYGCGSCHQLRHVRKATGMVGPPLDGIADQETVAGKLSNSPENLQRWIRSPQEVNPGTAMPDLHVGAEDARDISAFLYTRTS